MNETEKQDSINANYEYNALLAEVQAFRQKALVALPLLKSNNKTFKTMHSQDPEERRNEESLARTMGYLSGRIEHRSEYQRYPDRFKGRLKLPTDEPPAFPWVRVLIAIAVVSAMIAFCLGNLDAAALFNKALYPWK